MGRPARTRMRGGSRRSLVDCSQKQLPSTLSSTFNSIIPGPVTIRDYGIGATLMYALQQLLQGCFSADLVFCGVMIGVLLLVLLQLPLDQQKSGHEHSKARPKTDVLRRTLQYKDQRAAKGRKREKIKNDRSHLLVRLSAIYDTTTPDHCREALAEDVPALARRCASLTTQVRLRACASLWLYLENEALPRVRISLLRLGLLLLKPLNKWETQRYYSRGPLALVLQTLEEPNLEHTVHEASFIVLDQILQIWSWSEEDDNRVLRACICALQRHYETGESFSVMTKSAISFCMRECLEGGDAIGSLIDSDYTLYFLLDQVGSARASCGEMHIAMSTSIQLILKHSTQQERVTILARFYPMLERAIVDIDLYCVGELIEHVEVAGIALNCQPLLDRIAILLPLYNEHSSEYENVCRFAAYALDHALHDDAKLTELLGMGFITCARLYAHDPHDSNGAYIAPILTRVLAARPCWRARFKTITEGGPAANRVAILGRSQNIRRSRTGCYELQ